MCEEVATPDLDVAGVVAAGAAQAQAQGAMLGAMMQGMPGVIAGLQQAAMTQTGMVPGMVGMRVVDTNGDGVADSLVMPMATATMPAAQPQMMVQVPPGVVGGQMIAVSVNGAQMQVAVPMGLTGGQSFAISAPATVVAAPMVHAGLATAVPGDAAGGIATVQAVPVPKQAP
jgi:hypothetical protein